MDFCEHGNATSGSVTYGRPSPSKGDLCSTDGLQWAVNGLKQHWPTFGVKPLHEVSSTPCISFNTHTQYDDSPA